MLEVGQQISPTEQYWAVPTLQQTAVGGRQNVTPAPGGVHGVYPCGQVGCDEGVVVGAMVGGGGAAVVGTVVGGGGGSHWSGHDTSAA